MKKKILFLGIICISIILLGNSTYSQKKQLSEKEKVDDFKYVYNVIKTGYPYLDVNKRLNDIDWLENKDKYIKRIKNTESDEEFIEEMSSILSELNNKHTELIDNKNRYELFKKSYSNNNWYDFLNDKKVVDRYDSINTKIKMPNDIFVKKELILEDIIKGKVGYMYLPAMSPQNGSIDKDLKMIGDYINNLEKHQVLIIDIRGNSGGSDRYWKGIVSKLIKNDIKIEGYRLYRNNNKIVKKYTNARNIKLEPIENLPVGVKKNAPEETLKNFSDFEKTSYTINTNNDLKFQGNIYLLIDEKVYSSSESFSMFCKETKLATLVGETTGGDGGGIDPVLFELKNSGLIVRMSSCMYLNKDGICDEEFKTIPEFKVKDCKRTINFKDDNSIKRVLKLENINY
ncbi:S41 family peptidase [Clostridioides sp. ZZV14-6044]|uniref:S41 family peptidase n=1 Tax=unclassified Clostridioides TaxID=2635829 RepID=UPI001D12B08C|nr:peptidase S41 [Clostridioides sp. ZZV14-6154]MCC0721595.1 peptidase S41 [Clostridioides sp. ZZV14-6104]MCC0732441.1 peptidase S41 [Clostridioides sp. ZZV14-6048]MCC0744347.1 peptidase S41 [Clostridioides sp. ZZV14-6044]MCC0750490.1 peptidase S41 [Clostridioides sp. ZZV13-5731]